MLKVIAVALLLTACSSSPPPISPPIAATTPSTGHVQQTVKARVTMKVSGAATANADTDTTVQIVEIYGGKTPVITWFLSVSAAEPITLADGRTVLYTADLSPGLYRGAGSYKMQSEAAVDVDGQSSPLGSAAYVSLLRTGPPIELLRFDVLTEPCTLTATEDAMSGTVTCPKLSDANGKSVRLEWSWKRI